MSTISTSCFQIPGLHLVRLALPLGLVCFLAACDDSSTEAAPGIPVAVELLTEPPATAPVGDTIELRVRARDASGGGVADVDVEFQVVLGSGSLVGPIPQDPERRLVIPTDSQGEATVDWTLGLEEGDQSVRVSGLGTDGEPFSQLSVEVTAVPAN